MMIFLTMTYLKGPLAEAKALRCTELFTEESQGPTRVFYKNESSRRRYGKVLLKTKPGDILDFGGGDRFQVKTVLGQGQTTLVVETTDGLVLRIPKIDPNEGKIKKPKRDEVLFGFINDFVKIQQELDAVGVPVVKLDLQRSRVPKFLVVEKINLQFDLREFTKNYSSPEKLHLSAQQYNDISKGLIKFAQATWAYEYFGDFRADQLGWDGKRWVLFDFAFSNIKMRNFTSEKNIFTPLDVEDDWGIFRVELVPKLLYSKIHAALNQKRREQARSQTWFERPEGGGDFLLYDLISVENLVGKSFDLEKVEGEFDPSKTYEMVHIKVLKILKQSSNSVLYKVDVEGQVQGFLEVQIKMLDHHADVFFKSAFSFDKKLAVLLAGEDFKLFLAPQ
ncbi:MAG: hypothetical protein H7328_12275 [Bdellovibrio sp.]|nr:hypothetical protein [Bdellovibrio sp.]